MRRSFVLSFSLLSLAAFPFMTMPRAARASDLSYARIVRLSVVSGDVQVSRPSHPGWEPAAENMPMMQGMTLGTNDGYAEVQFEDGTTAWIAPNTLVQFTELALADGGRVTKLTLGQGTMSVLTVLRRGDSFSLATAEETITTPKNSLFRIDAFHDGASVSVLGGEVEVASAGETRLVPRGKTFAYRSKLKNEALKDVALQTNPKADEWDRWVVTRARQTETEAAQSASYVNAPFSYGMADLSQYGSWSYFAGYGYGWQPIGMGNCWMPFANGQWDYYSGFGWTWVSSEPWGWMPYHFGSWNYLPSNGWTWFPTSFDFWDPAPVNWYAAGNQVGWWPASASSFSDASFSDPSGLMFDQIASGCPGMGGMPMGAFGAGSTVMAMAVQPTKGGSGAPPRGKLPTPPRLLLTTKRLGGGGEVRLFASGAQGKRAAFAAGEPLENGKETTMLESRFAVGRGAAAARPTKMFAPTVGSVVQLRASLAARSASMPAHASLPAMRMNSRMPAIPMRENLRAVNAMPMPSSMPRRPAPMYFPRENAGSYQGERGGESPSRGFSGGAPAMSAPVRAAMPSAPSGAAHVSAGGGRPH